MQVQEILFLKEIGDDVRNNIRGLKPDRFPKPVRCAIIA